MYVETQHIRDWRMVHWLGCQPCCYTAQVQVLVPQGIGGSSDVVPSKFFWLAGASYMCDFFHCSKTEYFIQRETYRERQIPQHQSFHWCSDNSMWCHGFWLRAACVRQCSGPTSQPSYSPSIGLCERARTRATLWPGLELKDFMQAIPTLCSWVTSPPAVF